MKTLVIGGTGFIGSHVVERLRRRGDDVRCLGRDRGYADRLEALNAEVVIGDINGELDWAHLFDGVLTVYYLAGLTRARSTRESHEANILATSRFVGACRTFGLRVERLLYVSSIAAVGPSPRGRPMAEDTPCHPVSEYGRSKRAGELEVLAVRNWIPLTLVRLCTVYGPRDRDLYEYMRIIDRGVEPLVGFVRKSVSLLHVDDAVSGIVAAAEQGQAVGQVYHIGSETVYAIEEVGRAMAAALGRSPLRVRVPHLVLFAAAGLADIVALLTRTRRVLSLSMATQFAQRDWTCCIDKARTELGFQQTITLDEGMRRTAAWYRKQGWL
jgi:nucleoside-diphosphate-sugar epimerase